VLIESKYKSTFEEQLNGYLNDGYELVGNIVIIFNKI